MHATTRQTASAGPVWGPSLFKATAGLTFALGVVIHSTRVVMGNEPFLRTVYTPTVDIAFACLILVAAIAGLLAWRRYSGGRAGRIVYAFAMFMLLFSVPVHFRTLLTWSTDYLSVFPVWYSVIEIPMFLALSIVVTQLKFERSPGPT